LDLCGAEEMVKKRTSENVIQQLLDEMAGLVNDYAPGVGRTGTKVDELIQGTACFPGGTGVWRGDCYGKALPKYFPDRPVMFVSHNFDSISKYDEALELKGEIGTDFWKNLKRFLRQAGLLDPSACFFTNALMGLKSGSASGTIPGGRTYREQCRRFLLRQIEITNPRAVIPLGCDAQDEYRMARKFSPSRSSFVEVKNVMHPSARPLNWGFATREDWIAAQAEKIRHGIARIQI
jgi:hypothetical protein